MFSPPVHCLPLRIDIFILSSIWFENMATKEDIDYVQEINDWGDSAHEAYIEAIIDHAWKCVYCGEDLLASTAGYKVMQKEHIAPQKQCKEKGIDPEDSRNLAPSCSACNNKKRNKAHPDLFNFDKPKEERIKIALGLFEIADWEGELDYLRRRFRSY